MPGKDAFTVEGVVIEVLSERTGRVKLLNGHVVFGFMVARDAGRLRLVTGQTVDLKLSPYDLSEGRILVKQNKI